MMRWMLAVTVLAAGPVQADAIKFEKVKISSEFVSEGVAVGDINHDGRIDLFAGNGWYEQGAGGKWNWHQLRPAKFKGNQFKVVDGQQQYEPNFYSNCFAQFAQDINGDGWVDVIICGFPGEPFYWYENPKNAGAWKEHSIWRSVTNETPLFVDLLGDGKPGVVAGYEPEGVMAFFRPGPDPTKPWEPIDISAPKSIGTFKYYHGLGAGDVNQDGKLDVIIPDGWWEQPARLSKQTWTFHEQLLMPPKTGRADRDKKDASNIHVLDLNGDGRHDVLSSAAHHYGVWWFENTGSKEKPTYAPHMIRDDVSQTHASCLVDLNGDGKPELVTGKRYYAHAGDKDPGGLEPAHLFYIELQQQDGKPVFVSHAIDDDSGVGTQFTVADLNGDGRLDIITSNKKGTQVFLQKAGAGL